MAEKCGLFALGLIAAATTLASPRPAQAQAQAQATDEPSAQAAKAMYSLGASYQSMALYEEAAESYERFASAHPRDPNAPVALSDAVILRLGLGDEPAATKDAAAFLKTWAATRRAQAAQIELALALHHAERGATDRARAILRGAMELFDGGPLDLTIRAHALAATVAENRAAAGIEHAKVLALWSDPDAGERAIRHAWPAEGDGRVERRLAHALNAVGAARFFAAEQRRHAEVDSLRLPVHAGAIERVALLAFAQSTLRDWYVKKRDAIDKVEAEYVKILEIRPFPPPASVIAAGAAVGSMWGALADDFRRVPTPATWKKDPVYKPYFEAVEAMSEPIRTQHARPAMRKCVDLSVKYQFFDASSRACAAWLESHYKTEYRAVDEIIPAFRDPPGPAFALRRPDPPLPALLPPPDR